VSSPDWFRCVLHEWPVFPLRGSADDLALAAFSLRRVRAARKSNSQNGLEEGIRCGLFKGPLRAYSVEKLRHAKIASEIWNAVLTIG